VIRRPWPRLAALLPLLAVVLLVSPAARPAQDRERPARPPAAATRQAAPGGVEIAVQTIAVDGATLWALAPVASRLGGRLEQQPGGSWSLAFDDGRVLFGTDSGALAIGTEVQPLSRAPQAVGGAIYVPGDFLERVYGRFGGWSLTLDAAAGRVRAAQRSGRTLAVATDVVHLQGVTTVVLQFAERPSYRVERRAGSVVVELAADRVEALRPRPIADPLVSGIEIAGSRIVLSLAAGAEAESYTLDSPFRLVFDVHRREGEAVAEAPPELARPEPPEGIRVIVIDPGHGGSESGAVGPSGAAEKDLTLALARTLKARLEAELPVRVTLTRDEDANLLHETRTAIANQNKADLFISLHLNSAFGPTAHGAETYFLSAAASDERAARSAAAENRPAPGGAPTGDDPLYELQLMLWDLAQNHFLTQSQRLATLIQGELNTTLGLRDRGVKQAPFKVLMGAGMPAVLVERGFLSNPDEEAKLENPAYQEELVAALVRAVARIKPHLAASASPATAADRGDADLP
jgi:N-acetylmuramoyl-L-alanine amidase